ncbi:MAG: response regulator transcription factor [Actinomycetes bacterium]
MHTTTPDRRRDARERRSVLIADQRPIERVPVVDTLTRHGFDVAETESIDQVFELLESSHPDALVVDLTLSDRAGLDLLRDLSGHRDLVVIAVGAGSDEIDCVTALEMGAHDYVARPIPSRELVARLRSAIRRAADARGADHQVRTFGPMQIDVPAKEVRLDDVPIPLTAREFELLAFLAAHPRRVYSREQLLDQVWGSRSEWQSLGTVSEHIRRIRRKLGCEQTSTDWIRTMRGAGYRFEPNAA